MKIITDVLSLEKKSEQDLKRLEKRLEQKKENKKEQLLALHKEELLNLEKLHAKEIKQVLKDLDSQKKINQEKLDLELEHYFSISDKKITQIAKKIVKML